MGFWVLLGVMYLLVTVVVVAALRGKDIEQFELMRTQAPKQFRNIVWTCRINPVLLLAFAPIILLTMLGTEPTTTENDLPLAEFLAIAPLSLPLLFLIGHWTNWAWRVKL